MAPSNNKETKPMTALLNEEKEVKLDIHEKLLPMMDISKDFKLTTVHLDPMVALKIVKHAREQVPQTVNGQLLGLQVENVLEITQSYPVPTQMSEDESAQYQVEMLHLLREVNADTDSVGWYQSTVLSNFLEKPFLETQLGYHSSLKSKCVALVFDITQTERGNLGFRAYRLSDKYLKLAKESSNARSDNAFTTKKLSENKLSYGDVLEELPVYIKNGSLTNVLMQEIETTSSKADLLEALQRPSSFDARLRAKKLQNNSLDGDDSNTFGGDENGGLLPCSTPFLSVPNPNSLGLTNNVESLAKPLETICDVIDEHIHNAGQWMYWQRGAAKEQRRANQYIHDIKQKNITRANQGLKLIPEPTEKEIAEKFRILPEPSRLDALLINAQLHELCQQINQITGPAVSKLYATQALQPTSASSATTAGTTTTTTTTTTGGAAAATAATAASK
ncbi:hypothetical protein H4219_004799 [Mycoemilia scoparia]|uniref:MPN domain-containing protein n=1 Tax=Mycoemilia scoparia TaxID=417184 RepID=A0A9W8DR95_9FUNG|nr:hypothetical protein H4219_004799 [Mycoemilia scoparia]